MQHQDQYLRELRRQGYITVRSLGTGHLKIYDPHGCLAGVHSGNGGSDRRSLANLKADIRRHEQRCPSSAAAQQDDDYDDDQDQDYGSDADVHQAPCR
jgi:hypothetical protein